MRTSGKKRRVRGTRPRRRIKVEILREGGEGGGEEGRRARTVSEEVKADEEDDDQIEWESIDGKKRSCGKKGRTQRKRGEKRADWFC